jgi:hypothetical protein
MSFSAGARQMPLAVGDAAGMAEDRSQTNVVFDRWVRGVLHGQREKPSGLVVARRSGVAIRQTAQEGGILRLERQRVPEVRDRFGESGVLAAQDVCQRVEGSGVVRARRRERAQALDALLRLADFRQELGKGDGQLGVAGIGRHQGSHARFGVFHPAGEHAQLGVEKLNGQRLGHPGAVGVEKGNDGVGARDLLEERDEELPQPGIVGGAFDGPAQHVEGGIVVSSGLQEKGLQRVGFGVVG